MWRGWTVDYRVLGLIGLIVVSIGVFLAAPWSMEEKGLVALHGLCAQQPTHSFWFGESRLPFDARMTGIYGGFLIVGLYLLARGRLYRSGPPPVSLLIILAAFVAIMGIDGINSTLEDFGMPYVYEPSNHLRFFTGAMTGIAMATFLWMLATSVIWSPDVASPEPVIQSWKELIPIGILVTMFWGVLQIDAPVLFPPLALILVISGVLVISSIALVAVRLVAGGIQKAMRPADVARSALVAIVIAYAVMSAISGARFMLEAAVPVQG